MIRRIKACLNGGRTDPPVPVTPAQLADAATGAVAAGAEAVHLHPRGPDGHESLAAADVGAAVSAARRAGAPVGVSTGLWITGGDVAARQRLVRGWAELDDRPDFASVNVGEEGYAGLVDTLTGLGVAVEAGVWTPAEADRAGDVSRILVEIIGTPAGAAVSAADAVLDRLHRLDLRVPVLLHGEDAACWPLVAHAGRLGLPTRIGFEDTLTFPDGSPAPDNAALVRRALAVWTAGQVQ
ncbi:3-keto-5-aminohexanoate cleavage protein [Jidongwangia harbinensis]|uniref:3-keto-5-aminohexanoate cleavage protein n=1 Tax=Jidongwangia harbinensis TaxID=2878561 RepID=UPI001CD97EBB|nr:3-keto-5-aminohexanoate cleavage protein [Jidongwangia harbinensis]MCA2216375.1 3-keto-5-aminohexanoate cleavage protein [Jidongwangia harbinensis]MCA2217110.1 3-keto-5-aminohexanoate cleavage protein [Jidongwangia harbinensis]